MSDILNLRVTGMTCGGCENAVKRTLLKLPGIVKVDASHAGESVRVEFIPESVKPDAIRAAIQTLGYDVQP